MAVSLQMTNKRVHVVVHLVSLWHLVGINLASRSTSVSLEADARKHLTFWACSLAIHESVFVNATTIEI